MRKLSSVISVIIMLLTVAFIAVPRPAVAFVPVAEPRVWEVFSAGVTGQVVPMFTITTKPGNWYQLKSDGIKVDGPTKICHPFDEGRFGWTGEIFQLVEGAWVKLSTTVGWVPTVEGKFKACAQAPAAGTYALFAYFDKAKAPVVECQYDTSGWTIGEDEDEGGDYFYAHVQNLPFGTLVTYVVVGMYPAGSITGAMSGSGTVGNKVGGDADFLGYNVVIDPTAESATVRVSAAGCVVVLTEFLNF
jgi:hypothetical protein